MPTFAETATESGQTGWWLPLLTAGIGALVTALFTGVYALSARRDATEKAKQQRKFDRAERRHDDLKSAYENFIVQMRSNVHSLEDFWQRIGAPSPAEHYGEHIPLNAATTDALAKVDLYGHDDTRAAAEAWVAAFVGAQNGTETTRLPALEEVFLQLARRDLRGEQAPEV